MYGYVIVLDVGYPPGPNLSFPQQLGYFKGNRIHREIETLSLGRHNTSQHFGGRNWNKNVYQNSSKYMESYGDFDRNSSKLSKIDFKLSLLSLHM